MTDLSVTRILAATGMPHANVSANWPLLLSAMQEAGVASFASQVGMAATVAVETGDFTPKVENLNYSASGLRETWPKRFLTDEFAEGFHRQPEKIANYVYAGRNGNGDSASGDGWHYRGRGFIQLTGRSNYTSFGHGTLADPDRATQPIIAAQAAVWFWIQKGVAPSCDLGDWKSVRRKVNGGLTHYALLLEYVGKLEGGAAV